MAPLELPNIHELKKLETIARRKGSGVQTGDLIGHWKVWKIWRKSLDRSSHVGGRLLRSLAATLEIQELENGELRIGNGISIGFLRLSFRGTAKIKSKRPLLFFSFTEMELSFAGRNIFILPLPQASPKNEAFFALIARDITKNKVAWWAARGRGGGVALWVRQEKNKH